jgi:phenylpropionate dioxygenase-like ring-hydroxylating dioxygenase large terminal subunit
MPRPIPLQQETDPYAKDGVPELGFRNYWYPIATSAKVGRKPRRTLLCGEEVVLFRDGGKVHALADRCAHRGARLSRGKCEFPNSGTISCPYHGWTFDGKTGACVAALMEGPTAAMHNVRIRAYPVADRFGVIWVWVGDMEPVSLFEDIPEWLAEPDAWYTMAVECDYRCNWRVLVDNYSHEYHGPYVHRMSPELILQPNMPFAYDLEIDELPGGNGVGYRPKGGIRAGDYPGLGRWPRKEWYRFMKPTGRGKVPNVAKSKAEAVYGIKHLRQQRMPGYALIGRTSGEYWLSQHATPLDADNCRLINLNMFRRRGRLSEIYDRVNYAAWRGWAHDIVFSGQDKRLLDDLKPGAEKLSRTDKGVVFWRKYAVLHARRPPEPMPVRQSAE